MPRRQNRPGAPARAPVAKSRGTLANERKGAGSSGTKVELYETSSRFPPDRNGHVCLRSFGCGRHAARHHQRQRCVLRRQLGSGQAYRRPCDRCRQPGRRHLGRRRTPRGTHHDETRRGALRRVRGKRNRPRSARILRAGSGGIPAAWVANKGSEPDGGRPAGMRWLRGRPRKP